MLVTTGIGIIESICRQRESRPSSGGCKDNSTVIGFSATIIAIIVDDWTGDEWFTVVTEARAEGYNTTDYHSIEQWLLLKTAEVMYPVLLKRCLSSFSAVELKIANAAVAVMNAEDD